MIKTTFWVVRVVLGTKNPTRKKSPNPNGDLGRPEGAARPFAIFGDLADEAGLHRFSRWGTHGRYPHRFFSRGEFFWKPPPIDQEKDRYILYSLIRGKWWVYKPFMLFQKKNALESRITLKKIRYNAEL